MKKQKIKKLPSVLSVVKCIGYEQVQVDRAIRQSLQNVGGLNSFIKPGDKVHIKPNLLTAKSPEKASTTHPAVVRSVVKMVQESGGIITIGDSPAGISLNQNPYLPSWNRVLPRAHRVSVLQEQRPWVP